MIFLKNFFFQGHEDDAAAMGSRRDMCRRKLRGAQQMLNDVKIVEFNDAKLGELVLKLIYFSLPYKYHSLLTSGFFFKKKF